jgi:hypothetical protein
VISIRNLIACEVPSFHVRVTAHLKTVGQMPSGPRSSSTCQGHLDLGHNVQLLLGREAAPAGNAADHFSSSRDSDDAVADREQRLFQNMIFHCASVQSVVLV